MQRRAGKIHKIVVRIQSERDVIRNVEDAVPGADDGLLIQGVGEAESRRKRLLIHRDVVLTGVATGSHQECVARASGSYSAATSGRTVGRQRIPIGETPVGVGPRTLQLITKANVDGQLAGRVPSVVRK